MLYRVAAAICARAPAMMSVSAATGSCPDLACGRLVESRCTSCYSSCFLFVTLLLQLLLGQLLTFQVPQQCLRYILHICSKHGGMQLLTKASGMKASGMLEASYSIRCRHLSIEVVLAIQLLQAVGSSLAILDMSCKRFSHKLHMEATRFERCSANSSRSCPGPAAT